MESSSFRLIAKEFGIETPYHGKWDDVRMSVSRVVKATVKMARRHALPHMHGTSDCGTGASQTEMPRLPPELLDQVIDYLHDDPCSLRSCSLVCHALVASARFHLFQTVLINGKNFARAVALFAGKAPHLAGYVRTLTFEADGEPFDRLRDMLKGKDMTVLLRSFMLIIAPMTRNVTKLTLKDVPFDKSVVAMLTPNFPQLQSLSLFDCWFRCNADLDALFREHPHVQYIRCGRVSSLYGGAPPDSDDRIGPPLAVPVLKITEAYSPSPLTLMSWLVLHSNPEHFVITLYRLSQLTKLNHCLFELSSLKHLHIIFYRWRKNDTQEVLNSPAVLMLTPRHPLTTLTLDGKLHNLMLVVNMLAQLDPHTFTHLNTINIYAHIKSEDVAAVAAEAWAGMDQTLSVLLSLGAVNFFNSCTDISHVQGGQEAIVACLPVLNARKILNFGHQQPPE